MKWVVGHCRVHLPKEQAASFGAVSPQAAVGRPTALEQMSHCADSLASSDLAVLWVPEMTQLRDESVSIVRRDESVGIVRSFMTGRRRWRCNLARAVRGSTSSGKGQSLRFGAANGLHLLRGYGHLCRIYPTGPA